VARKITPAPWDRELWRACVALDDAVAEGIDPAALAYVLREGLGSGYFSPAPARTVKVSANVIPLRPEPT
jgi:hypothetical protein